MKLFSLSRRLNRDESGAITVDWVVLTSAIVGLGIAIVGVVRLSSQDLADRIAEAVNPEDAPPPDNCHTHADGGQHCP